MKKQSLVQLLEWAKKENHYIEIFCDGQAMVEYHGESIRVEGGTLHEALELAQKKFALICGECGCTCKAGV